MSSKMTTKPHVVLTPFPAQGHLKPLLNLAKLLHFHNFHISFVLTEFTYCRLVLSRGPDSVKGLEDFKFYTIPDGLMRSDTDPTQDIPSLCASTCESCSVPFKELIQRHNGSGDSREVDCIVFDGAMSFTVHVASELKIPVVVFITHSRCGFLSYLNFAELVERGYSPLKG